MLWKDFLSRKDDFIGGDIMISKDGEIFRGPLKLIKVRGEDITFECQWYAHEEPNGTWKKCDAVPCSTEMDGSTPKSFGDNDNNIFITIQSVGSCLLLPANGRHLDPTKVIGF